MRRIAIILAVIAGLSACSDERDACGDKPSGNPVTLPALY